MSKSIHIIIEGNVQGVGFRHFVCENAKSLYLNGWVQNLSSGKVEAVIEGKQENLEKVIKLIENGSPASKPTKININYLSKTHGYSVFKIKY